MFFNRYLTSFFLSLVITTTSFAEIITSNFTPMCKYSGAQKSPKDQFKFLIKFKFPHSGSLANGWWEQVFSGYCDLKGNADEISIITLSGPVNGMGFDVVNLGPRDFKCDSHGGVILMSWGIHTVTINLTSQKASYTSEEGVNVETSCK